MWSWLIWDWKVSRVGKERGRLGEGEAAAAETNAEDAKAEAEAEAGAEADAVVAIAKGERAGVEAAVELGMRDAVGAGGAEWSRERDGGEENRPINARGLAVRMDALIGLTVLAAEA